MSTDLTAQVTELHAQLVNSRKVRKLPAQVREDWSQQVYLELLELEAEYEVKALPGQSFSDYVCANLSNRMRTWWSAQQSWRNDVVLVPECYPPFEEGETEQFDMSCMSDLEIQVWDLVIAGFNAREASEKIGKSYDMTRKIISGIYQKMRAVYRGDAQ